jgi:chondroitin 4-sulfotransferase 11
MCRGSPASVAASRPPLPDDPSTEIPPEIPEHPRLGTLVRSMFISHKTRAIFIHIQKTAGDAIETAMRKDDPSIETDRFAGRRHLFARDVEAAMPPEIWSTYFRFAFVRNRWDRLVSWYCMCMQRPPGNLFSRHVRENAPTFTDFITRTTTGIGARTTYNQLDFIVGESGETIVEFIGRYENLANDYAVVRERLRLAHDLPHTNTSSHTSYRDYYTTVTKAIVADRFARDIAYFQYDF